MPRISVLSALTAALGVCTACATAHAADAAKSPSASFETAEFATFDHPWAMTFLPGGRLLVTEMGGTLRLFDPATKKTGTVTGTPKAAKVSQGGLGDVVLHPDFATNQLVYLSYVEPGEADTYGGAVARGRLVVDDQGGGRIEGLETIWRQVPKQTGEGHFGNRIAFGPDGKLWVTSGERQKFDPAQDMTSNLGKTLRLNDDGSVPADNPFAERRGVAAQVWSLGHRNILGLAFDAEGRLWEHEMGPKGGDELNLITKGANYGYPIVSNGDHYDGKRIPDHPTRPDFPAPVITWNPVISPAGFVIYDGTLFPSWKGSGLIGGLSSKSLVRVSFDGASAREAERWDMGTRIREVEQGPDGAVWLLEDGKRGGNGRLLKLTPKS
ncbi:PQQ-dependent sugar dehydrogenase [Cognatilysobacter bugurensis]|uniref:Dehydrogenase n=1 Tax=Cognatilysobacter bugurensis TaxID=543356 RepID=A0A918SUD5_9GAMM|nr:PQQ-dependent sugar dehydrogenase [Lysobacter bugurensis]GHA72364.1 dehydrogenase [Lysobacter bugurensis]